MERTQQASASSSRTPRRRFGCWARSACAGVVLLLIAVALVLVLGPRPGLRIGKFADIRPGMTRAEVCELLGGPPGYYGPAGNPAAVRPDRGVLGETWGTQDLTAPADQWWDEYDQIDVIFDAEGRAVAANHACSRIPGFVERLRRRVGY